MEAMNFHARLHLWSPGADHGLESGHRGMGWMTVQMSLAPWSWYSLLILARKSYLNSVEMRLNWTPVTQGCPNPEASDIRNLSHQMLTWCQEESMLYAFLSDVGMWNLPIMAKRRGMTRVKCVLTTPQRLTKTFRSVVQTITGQTPWIFYQEKGYMTSSLIIFGV